MKDIQNAMINALQTVDTNHASHQQIIQAQTQHLQRLTAEQEAFKTAMQALSEANVELFNPGNFSACAQDLTPGLLVDMSVDPQMDMRVETYRTQTRHNIA